MANYREAYGLFACSGILFNHESPLRPERFVTQKIIAAACRIAAGSKEKLSLGNISIKRDWGWAPDYVEAMWRMLQEDEPSDFVIATGKLHSLEEMVETAFSLLDLNWREHVTVDPSLIRPIDVGVGWGNPSRARVELGWQAQHNMFDVVRMMVEAQSTGRLTS